MHELKQAIANISLAVADAIASMDDGEFELLIQGKAKLRIVEHQKSKKSTSKLLNDSDIDEAISDMAKRLNTAKSRECARDLLASINQPRKKDFLLFVAKSCGVKVESRDSIARIEQKLIEDVVGPRLDSEAIRKMAF